MNTRKAVLAILLAAALLISMAATASADGGSQTWYLSSSLFETGPHKVMYKGSQSGDTDYVMLLDKESVLWIADEVAACDVDLSGVWSGHLKKAEDAPMKIQVDIGIYDGSAFISYGYTEDRFPPQQSDMDFTISAPDFTVYQNEYLAFKLTNRQQKDDFNIVTVGEQSYVTSPLTDPGYPVPELPTIVLTGVGLLGLMGYVIYNKRKAI